MTYLTDYAMFLQPLTAGAIMTIGRPIPAVILSPDIKEQLEKMASSRSLPHALVRRADCPDGRRWYQ
jgi:hypothetical protein